MKTLVIDAGHGGSDSGALGGGFAESWLNMDVANRLKPLLDPYVNVLMTRQGNEFVSLPYRSKFSNENNADAFLSIHFNYASAASASGMEIFTSPQSSQAAKDLARHIADHHAARFPGQKLRGDNGLKQSSFSVLQNTKAPAVLWEGGFLSNESEADFIGKDATRQGMAESLAAGVMAHWEIAEGVPELTLEQRVTRIENHLLI